MRSTGSRGRWWRTGKLSPVPAVLVLNYYIMPFIYPIISHHMHSYPIFSSCLVYSRAILWRLWRTLVASVCVTWATPFLPSSLLLSSALPWRSSAQSPPTRQPSQASLGQCNWSPRRLTSIWHIWPWFWGTGWQISYRVPLHALSLSLFSSLSLSQLVKERNQWKINAYMNR